MVRVCFRESPATLFAWLVRKGRLMNEAVTNGCQWIKFSGKNPLSVFKIYPAEPVVAFRKIVNPAMRAEVIIKIKTPFLTSSLFLFIRPNSIMPSGTAAERGG